MRIARTSLSTVFFLSYALVTASCNDDASGPVDDTDGTVLDGKADGATTARNGSPIATIDFSLNWSELVRNGVGSEDFSHYAEQTLYQGGRACISAAWPRLPGCRDDGAATLGVRAASGAQQRVRLTTQYWPGFEAGNTYRGCFDLPSSGENVQLWLQCRTRDGNTVYDSRWGQNYSFALRPWNVKNVAFDGAGSAPSVSSAIHAGDVLALDFAPERLPRCRAGGMPGSSPSWGIYVHVKFDSDRDRVRHVRVAWSGGVTRPALLAVPADATHFETWIENADYPSIWYRDMGGCADWDSLDGRNYQFDVAR